MITLVGYLPQSTWIFHSTLKYALRWLLTFFATLKELFLANLLAITSLTTLTPKI